MDHSTITNVIGWGASAILLLTLARQVFSQWRSRCNEGVSHWLFSGQLVSSAGFFTYSFLVKNYIFLLSNVMLILTAVAGQLIYFRNAKRPPPNSGSLP